MLRLVPLNRVPIWPIPQLTRSQSAEKAFKFCSSEFVYVRLRSSLSDQKPLFCIYSNPIKFSNLIRQHFLFLVHSSCSLKRRLSSNLQRLSSCFSSDYLFPPFLFPLLRSSDRNGDHPGILSNGVPMIHNL